MGVFALRKSTASNKLELKMNTKDGTADEREEGEIIDEFEDIISSDEEFSMRQRIEELEAKNAELEKIANISGLYESGNYDYMKKDSSSHLTDRYPLISIDISDDEDYPPAPPMTRIGKRRKSLQHAGSRRKIIHTSSSSHRRRKKSSSPPPAPQYRASDKLLLSLFHDRVAAHSSHSSKRKRKSKKTHSTKCSRRKSREYYVSDSDDDYNFVDVDDSFENFNCSDADRSFPINREELRVALARNTHRNEQHVSLKDRLIRRKENTDTLNEKTTPDPQEEVEEEENKALSYEEKPENEDNLEEQELRIIALKSAVIRKHLVRKKRNENVAYSPSDFDEIYANIPVSPINNIDDTEACNSMEISPVPSPKMILSDDEGIDTKPVDMDIANSDSDCELPSYEKWVPIEQIPLPNNVEIGGGELYVPNPLRYNDGMVGSVIPPEVRFESASVSPGNLDSEVEEEELALRALLLAKMNSPKVNKIAKEEPPKVEDTQIPDPDISLEAEALRHFLINNMKKKTQPTHSSASVLKEAVRRLTARNSSPAEVFTEIPVSRVDPPAKTAEETEFELGQAITEMAKVKIGVESDAKPKEVPKKVGLRVRRDLESKEILKRDVSADRADVEPKQIVKTPVLGDKYGVERNNIVKKEVLVGRGDAMKPKEVVQRKALENGGVMEPRKIVNKDVLQPKAIANRKDSTNGSGVIPKQNVKTEELASRGEVEPKGITKRELEAKEIVRKKVSEPKKVVKRNASRDRSIVGPTKIVKTEILEDGGEVNTKESEIKDVVGDSEHVELKESVTVTGDTSHAEPAKVVKTEVLDVESEEIGKKDVVGDRDDVRSIATVKKEVVESKEANKDDMESGELGGSDNLAEVDVNVERNQVVIALKTKKDVLKVVESVSREETVPGEALKEDELREEDVNSVGTAEKEVVFNEELVSDKEDTGVSLVEPSQKENVDMKSAIENEVGKALLSEEETANIVSVPQQDQPLQIQLDGEKEIVSGSGAVLTMLIPEDKVGVTSVIASPQIKTEEILETKSKSVVESITPSPEKEKVDDPAPNVPAIVESVSESNGESAQQNKSLEKEITANVSNKTEIIAASVGQPKTVETAAKAIPQSAAKIVKPREIKTALPIVAKSDKPVSKKPEPVSKKSLTIAQPTPTLQPISKITAQPTTSRTKIVKPNKVINQPTTELKRKSVDNVSKPSIPIKKTKTEELSNRLITAAEMPQVKQLIIQLRASDTESEYSAMSADDFDYDDRGDDSCVSSFLNRSIIIGNEYYDIASPISLPMESPCDTPTRAVSPVVNVTPTPQPIVEKSIVNDFFEAKLDQFLKNVRSKVADSVKKPVEGNQPVVTPVIHTPVAVRHLPEASQQEYRRLINRMKLLERQKQAKNLKVVVNTTTNGAAATAAESRIVIEGDNKTLVKKVLLKNATTKPTCDNKQITVPSIKHVPQKPKTPEKVTKVEQSSVAPMKLVVSPQKVTLLPQKTVVSSEKVVQSSPPKLATAAAKPSKENLLGLYENSYRKTGTSIISNLDKSIELVRVAREAKMAKLKHEHRLKELQKEMDEVARSVQQQQVRITEIYPQICSSHRAIESLKTRRGKINKAVTALGRSVIGPDYSMNNDQKTIISEKSKKLAAEIKFVNNMKLSDVEKWENENHHSSTDEAISVAVPKDLNSCLTVQPSSAIENEIDTLSSKNNVPVGDNKSPNTTPVPEDTEKTEPDLNDTIVPEAIANKDDPNDSTNGHEEALETEAVGDKQTNDPEKVVVETIQEEENAQVGGAKLQDYVSPLSHLRDDERQINPNGIVCPYQLMGQCDDKDCKYMHLDE